MPRTSEMNTDGIKALLKAELTDAVQALEALLAPHPAAYTGGLTLLTIEDCEAYKEEHHIDDEQLDEEDADHWQAVSEHSMPGFAARMRRVTGLNSAIMQGCNQQQETTAVLKALREIQAKLKESERQVQATLEAIRSELVTSRGGKAHAAAACEAGTSASGASGASKRQRADELSRGAAANMLRTAVGRGSGAKGPPGFERSAFDDEDAENVDEQTNTCIKVNDPSSARNSAMLLAYKLQTDRATQVRFYMSNYLQPWLFQRRTHSMPDRKEILVKLIEHMADEQKPLVSKNELDEVDADDLLGWAELLINSDEQLKKEFENLESAAWLAFGLRAKALVLDNMPMAMRGNIHDGFSAHLDSLLASAKYEQLNQLLQPLQNLARMPPVEEDGGADDEVNDEAQEAAPGPVLPPRPRQRAVQGAVKGLVGVDGNAAQIEELDKISSEMLPTARSLFFTDGKFLKTPDGSKHFVLELAQKMHSEFIGGVYKLERTGLAVTIFYIHHALDLAPKARAPHKGELWFTPSPSFRTIPAKLSTIAAFLKSSKYAPTEVAELAALQTRA